MAPLLSSGIANAVLEPFPTLPPVVRRPWEVGTAFLFLAWFAWLLCLLVGTCFGRIWQYSGGMAQCFGPVTPQNLCSLVLWMLGDLVGRSIATLGQGDSEQHGFV